MRCFALLLLFAVQSYAQSSLPEDYVPSLFSSMSNTTTAPIAEPPSLRELPSLDVISSIINATNTLDDIRSQFDTSLIPYEGAQEFAPSDEYIGVWSRFSTENTKLFDIPALNEEVLVIEANGRVLWLQNIKTKITLESRTQRMMIATQYNLFGYDFIVFHYADQDPRAQKIRDKQGYFVRYIEAQNYVQMSRSPNFETEKSFFWKHFPVKNAPQPVAETNLEESLDGGSYEYQ
ncbi:MAG: hypothetical protein ACRCS8_03095 [Brevinema sp.]